MVRLMQALVLGWFVGVITAADGTPDTFPPGSDFVTCGCIDGTIVEFCSGPCEDLEALCEEACRGYGNGTLFTACVPGGCLFAHPCLIPSAFMRSGSASEATVPGGC
jgi:hypothetical protein